MRAASYFSTPSSHPSPTKIQAPGPDGLPVVGNLFDIWRAPLDLLVDGFRNFGETVHYKVGPYDVVQIHKPQDIRHVLVTNAKNYLKSPTYKGLRLVLGNGLVTSEGDFWRRQRKLAQPAFHHRRLAELAGAMSECSHDLAEDWSRRDVGATLDVHEEMMKLTFRIVGRTLFSVELNGEADEFGPALGVALDKANREAESLINIPQWVPTPDNLRFRKAKAKLDGVVHDVIKTRRLGGKLGDDLLGMLMGIQDEETGESMSDEQLRDEVMTLVAAGHETTAVGLSWTFFLLSRHPDVARRVRSELDEVLRGAVPTLEDLPKLEYTGRVIDEAMRLYPPVWIFEREAIEADQLSDTEVPPGAIVAVCTWTAHRNPRLWENPEGFDPDRFTPDRVEARPRYAYIPFGAGPRMCIGNNFAKMESKLILATLMQRYRLELVAGHPVELDPRITLRPKHGMKMHLHPR